MNLTDYPTNLRTSTRPPYARGGLLQPGSTYTQLNVNMESVTASTDAMVAAFKELRKSIQYASDRQKRNERMAKRIAELETRLTPKS